MNELFRKFAHKTSVVVGSPWAFITAVAIIVIWAVTGPIFGFSDTWQLIINTGTTIVTFLMVFLIQNTQNRDAVAIHLKLDELIRGVKSARNSLVDLEDLSDEELEQLQQEFRRLRERYGTPGEGSLEAVEETLEKRESSQRANKKPKKDQKQSLNGMSQKQGKKGDK
ncbi:MAG TPA: low affinity iron permease family protein [Anaerolineae bacterium]|nr:low affinity iron permease family protein [Anaerolineae bacterium]